MLMAEEREDLLQHARPVFMGRRVKAEYSQSDEPNYCHNAFIEALPPIMNTSEAVKNILRKPVWREYERLWPIEKRMHAVQRISNFIQPMPQLVELEQRVSRMIRNGYFARNPISAEWTKQMRQAFDNLHEDAVVRSSAAGFAIIGTSGIGKTTAVESVLSLYPQVIEHTKYNGARFIRQQLVWMKLECPRDGSIKSLVLQFFQYADAVLGTTYYQKFCRAKRSAEELIPDMAFLAANFGLGVLIIDEIQRLKSASSGGMKKMLDFFTELINSIGVPVMLVGTYGAMRPLTKLFSNARRATGQGDMTWANHIQDEFWDAFVKNLWRYQWTNVPTEYSQEFNDVLYEESQGITDIAVKLYMIAQWSVIGEDNEMLTPRIFREVSRESLKLVRPVLDAMKAGDLEVLKSYEDVYPEFIDLEEFFIKAQERIIISGTLDTLKNQRDAAATNNPYDEESPEYKIVQWLVDAGIDERIAWEAANASLNQNGASHDTRVAMRSAFALASEETNKRNRKASRKSTKKNSLEPYSEKNLRKIASGEDSYEALKHADMIKEKFE